MALVDVARLDRKIKRRHERITSGQALASLVWPVIAVPNHGVDVFNVVVTVALPRRVVVGLIRLLRDLVQRIHLLQRQVRILLRLRLYRLRWLPKFVDLVRVHHVTHGGPWRQRIVVPVLLQLLQTHLLSFISVVLRDVQLNIIHIRLVGADAELLALLHIFRHVFILAACSIRV